MKKETCYCPKGTLYSIKSFTLSSNLFFSFTFKLREARVWPLCELNHYVSRCFPFRHRDIVHGCHSKYP